MSAADNPVRGPAALRQAFVGLVIGFDNLSRAIALAMLVFSGSLAAGASWGATIFLLTGVIGIGTLLTRRFFIGPAFSNVQNTTIAILMPAIFMIGGLAGSETVRITTVFALLGLTAMITGLTMVLMARFDLGRIIRIMPFPVSAGYLAASGALLIVSAGSLVCPGNSCSLSELTSGHGETFYGPILAVALAGFMAAAVWKWQGFGLVGALVLGLAGFYAFLALQGLTPDDARAAGLLPPVIAAFSIYPPPAAPAAWTSIDLSALVSALPLIITAALVSVFSTLLNITGVELAVKKDIATRNELMRAGIVNIGTGLAGSTVSFASASNCDSAISLGARGRIPGVVAAAVLLLTAIFATDLLAFVPPFASAGLLLFFGASIVNNWLIQSRHLQSRPEWLLCFFIVAASLLVGMPAAVLLGIVLASLVFAFNYARLPTIRSSTSLQKTRSTVDRGPVETRYLDAYGDEVVVVVLQGFLFFGSVERAIDHIRNTLRDDPRLRTVILDFSRVSRMDASALASLRKLDILATSAGAHIVLADLNPQIADELARLQDREATLALSVEASTEVALEKAENALLARTELPEVRQSVLSALESITGLAASAKLLLDAMQRIEVPVGAVLVREGEISGDVYILERGALSVFITTSNGKRLRVRKQLPGSIFGEIAAYMDIPRTADIEADTDSVVYCMSEARLKEIEETQPDLAARWHRAMASALADKLMRTNKLLGERAS